MTLCSGCKLCSPLILTSKAQKTEVFAGGHRIQVFLRNVPPTEERNRESVTNIVTNFLAPVTTGYTSPLCWKMDEFVPASFNSVFFIIMTRPEASK